MNPPPSVIRWYFGRDIFRRGGLLLVLQILPREDLMTEADETRVRLVGFEIRVKFRWPWGLRTDPAGWISYGDYYGWRSPILATVRSDAGEIAARMAAQGQVAR